MNVLLVYASVASRAHTGNEYSSGLGAIVSVTKQAGHQVRVLTVRQAGEYSELLDQVKSFQPRVVGFSVISHQFRFVKEMAVRIKAQAPATIIVCGGVHPTVYPEALLEKGAEAIDGFFVGEADFAFPEFLDRLEKGLSYRDTDNFAYAQNGTLVQNRLKPLIENLDVLPFPDKEMDSYRETLMGRDGVAMIFCSRGCPFLCAYCSNHAIAKRYGIQHNSPRFRSPESCIREIEAVIERYGQLVKTVFIGDEIFGANRRWRQEFCQAYKERINKPYRILLRVEMVKHDLLSMLKESGCSLIMFGVECGNEKFRFEVLNRPVSNEKIIRAFDLCHQYGLNTFAFNMIGLPGETEEMIWETIQLNRGIRPMISIAAVFVPLRGTALGERCFREGWIDDEAMLDFFEDSGETLLSFPEEHKQRLGYFYANCAMLVNPNTPEATIQSKRGQS